MGENMAARAIAGGALVVATAGALVASVLPWAAAAAPAPAPAAPAPTPAPAAATVADLRADVNRDGAVDVTGATDEAGEDRWSAERGAIFLPNLDDDARRCRTKDADGGPLPDARLRSCSDASDTVVNGRADAADLARLRTAPLPGAGRTASATVAVSGRGAAGRTRIFVRTGSAWKALGPTTSLTAAQVRAGVELGIEGRDVVRDTGSWDGRATVTLTVKDGRVTSTDAVVLKLAPVLVHHPLQRAQRLIAPRWTGSDPSAKDNQRFVRDLERHAKAAGLPEKLSTLPLGGEDTWIQDIFEPAYVTMPGAGGKPVGMRLMLRSPQNYHPDGRPSGWHLYERLRGPGIGVVEIPGMKKSEEWTLSSMGNLEKIPPYRLGAMSHPNGRVVMGHRPGKSKPAASLLRLLTAQEGRAPLLLDVSFLRIGHVDEFLHFVPADTPRGWRIAVADPAAGLRLLREAAAAGAGGTPVASKVENDQTTVPRTTVAQALADRRFVSGNELAARKIDENIALLRRETGVTTADIVRVPTLFRAYGICEIECGHDDTPEQASAPNLSAFLPSAVNGVLLAPDRYLAPRQFGPVVRGTDVFAAAVTAAYRGAGIKVSYADDWGALHDGAGNIHCGTNVLRDHTAPWWAGTP
jgi:protein-arginine deiminase